jgi:hypothetical protein
MGRKTQSWEFQEGNCCDLGGNGLFVVVKLTKPFLSKLLKDNFWNINVMHDQCWVTIAKVRQW